MEDLQQDKEYKLYLDDTAELEKRVDDLISRMTLDEKVSRLLHNAPEIPRLGLPEYNSWNECLHGVARAGIATVFPQVIGMAATFNDKLIYDVTTAISDEARAKHHEFARRGDRGIYKGLTECAPNVNIFRDPRWGRGQETFGEDPYLTGRMGTAYIKGLQGEDEKYLKTIAIVKHYAVHSGPERMRHGMDVHISKKDLMETYLYAFRRCVDEGGAASVMGAYNAVNGEPCCVSKTLLQDILRGQWGFEGYVQADYGAINDIHAGHRLTKDAEESSSWALESGCDLDCGWSYGSLIGAIEKGMVTEDDINRALKNVLKTFMRLGLMDAQEKVPYAQIPYIKVDCQSHRDLALETARQSMVLLKNEGKLLPLKKDSRIAVIGPNADEKKILLANYNGMPSKYVTFLQGIRDKVGNKTEIIYAEGCDHATTIDTDTEGRADKGFAEALAAAESADAVILCLGLSPDLEGEESQLTQFVSILKGIDLTPFEKSLPPDFMKLMDSLSEKSTDDKKELNLPGKQQELMEKLFAAGKPVVLVLANGSPLEINWAQENIPAIIEAWYPGEEGGTALADILFGDFSPAGRLPVTFVKSVDQLPPFESYEMQGRTYRYMMEEAFYPFGYGLSYTEFRYGNLSISCGSIKAGEPLLVNVEVENCGSMEGDEVVQLYIRHNDAACKQAPVYSLVDFSRIRLKPGQKTDCEFLLTPRKMALIDECGNGMIEPGRISIFAGGQQPDSRSVELTGRKVLEIEFVIYGKAVRVEY